MNTKTPRRLVIGISGASGPIYGIRMLEMLKKTDIETHLVISKSAAATITLGNPSSVPKFGWLSPAQQPGNACVPVNPLRAKSKPAGPRTL